MIIFKIKPMKNIVLVFFIFLTTSLIAKSKEKPKSKEVKNQKVWKLNKSNTLLVIGNHEKLKLRSKDFKNYKPWQRKNYSEKVSLTRKKEKQEYGGKAKNKKAWNN